MTDGLSDGMREGARTAWVQFIAAVEPLRPGLARYCRRLTGDIWDAEDLAHDTLLRAFGLLASVHYQPGSPRAYLFKIASNIWIDGQRRRFLEAELVRDPALAPPGSVRASQEDHASVRRAGEALVAWLAPQERAAVLLKDVFEMSLDEAASILGTTTGAVKAALHRGRGRLAEVQRASERPIPAPDVIDRFVDCYHARDLEGLVALMLDSASIEMTGVNNEFGREGFTRKEGWFSHLVGQWGDSTAPRINRWERRGFRGEPLAIQLTDIVGREKLTSVVRFETADNKEARLRSYTFCPDAVAEVAAELGLEIGPVFYSFPPFYAAWQPGGAFWGGDSPAAPR
jgi:RNA polymerase sigma-70 factor (ECF subfamily)